MINVEKCVKTASAKWRKGERLYMKCNKNK